MQLNDSDDLSEVPEVLPAEPGRRRTKLPRKDDQLEGYWKAIIWGSVLVPCFGGWVIVILSSVMYYVWLKEYPNKANSINRHGWMAWITGQAIAIVLWLFLSQLQPSK